MANEAVDIIEVSYYDEENPVQVKGNTPFGIFDDDPDFQEMAPKLAKRIARSLGYPVNDIEMTYENMYSSIERAMMEFTKIISEFKLEEDYFSLIGKDKDTVHRNKLVYPNLDYFLRLSDAYATETGVGGSVPIHEGKISVTRGQQLYDLKKEYFEQEHISENSFTIREIYHYRIPSAHIGTTAGNFVGIDSVDSLIGQFGFGGGSYNRYYTLMPLSWDVQRMQSVKMARMIRQSYHGFEITGNTLRLFPIPRADFDLYFKYTLGSEEKGENNTNEIYNNDFGDIINDPTKVDYSYFSFSDLSTRDKIWVYDYSEALAKITLGENRRKFTSLQYPNGEISMNGDQLVSEGMEEKRQLKEDIKMHLEKLSKERALQIEDQLTDAQTNKLRKIPLGIYRI